MLINKHQGLNTTIWYVNHQQCASKFPARIQQMLLETTSCSSHFAKRQTPMFNEDFSAILGDGFRMISDFTALKMDLKMARARIPIEGTPIFLL